MSAPYFIALAIIAVATYVYSSKRALAFQSTGLRGILHSLPVYHGWYLAAASALPMFLLFTVWMTLAPRWIESRVLQQLPSAMQSTDPLVRATSDGKRGLARL